jgi:hypothetical protein
MADIIRLDAPLVVTLLVMVRAEADNMMKYTITLVEELKRNYDAMGYYVYEKRGRSQYFSLIFVIDDMTAVGRSHNEKALEVGLQELQIIVRSGTTEAFSKKKKNVT